MSRRVLGGLCPIDSRKPERGQLPWPWKAVAVKDARDEDARRVDSYVRTKRGDSIVDGIASHVMS